MIEIRRTFNRDRGFKLVETLNGYTFTPETNAHTFFIECVDKVNGLETVVPFEAGSTVSARFLKTDHVTELVEGSLNTDGAAVVTLPSECYSVPGRFLLTILVTTGSTTICVYAATGTVIAADSSTINVSENASREIDEKIAELNAAAAQVNSAISAGSAKITEINQAAAAARASIPQDYTALSDSVGDLKSAVGKPQTSFLEQGNINTSTGIPSNSTAYIRTSEYLDINTVTVTKPSGVGMTIYYYVNPTDENNGFESPTASWSRNSARSGDLHNTDHPNATHVKIRWDISGTNPITVDTLLATGLTVDYLISSNSLEKRIDEIDNKIGVTANNLQSEIDTTNEAVIHNTGAITDIEAIIGRYESTEFSPEKYQKYNLATGKEHTFLPILYMDGDITGMSKDTSVTLKYSIQTETDYFAGNCTCKWQGSSSLAYPKKNYTIKTDYAIGIVPEWGRKKKYVLKGEFVDSSYSRNTCCGKLWAQIVADRESKNGAGYLADETGTNIELEQENETISIVSSNILGSPHAGCIDGFPVMVVINGEYKGVYIWGIPKDEWMFGMDQGQENCAVLNAEVFNNLSVRFRQTTTASELENEQSFAVEYASDDMTYIRIADSINVAITAVINATGNNYRNAIENYVDVDCAMDYLIFSVLISNWDGVAHNYNIVTYDGTKWVLSAYDMDRTFGLTDLADLADAGSSINPYKGVPYLPFESARNRLLYLPFAYDAAAFKARYQELRSGILSKGNVYQVFHDFVRTIPKRVAAQENVVWPTMPDYEFKSIDALMDYYDLRCEYIDSIVSQM